MKYPDYRDVLRANKVRPFVVERTTPKDGDVVIVNSKAHYIHQTSRR